MYMKEYCMECSLTEADAVQLYLMYTLLTALHTTEPINNIPKPPTTVQADYIHDLCQLSQKH